MDMPDGAAAQELGSIAHGPVLLTTGHGVAVGLRCVFAHRTGPHLPDFADLAEAAIPLR
jgi:hypothetical protein